MIVHVSNTFFFSCYRDHRDLHSFPTRRSSDLVCTNKLEWLSKRLLDQLGLSRRFAAICGADTFGVQKPDPTIFRETVARATDRKSTRLNSSHRCISYAVFCLKKKKKNTKQLNL